MGLIESGTGYNLIPASLVPHTIFRTAPRSSLGGLRLVLHLEGGGLRLEGFTWRVESSLGGWRASLGGLYLESGGLHLEGGGLHLEGGGLYLDGRGLRLEGFTWRSSLGGLHLGGWRASLGGIYLESGEIHLVGCYPYFKFYFQITLHIVDFDCGCLLYSLQLAGESTNSNWRVIHHLQLASASN